MTTAIQVNDLHYTYEGQDGGETHIVFDGLNLSIEQGSFVAVLGHNGCGKSTLLKTLNRMNDLIPDCRVEGSICLLYTSPSPRDA